MDHQLTDSQWNVLERDLISLPAFENLTNVRSVIDRTIGEYVGRRVRFQGRSPGIRQHAQVWQDVASSASGLLKSLEAATALPDAVDTLLISLVVPNDKASCALDIDTLSSILEELCRQADTVAKYYGGLSPDPPRKDVDRDELVNSLLQLWKNAGGKLSSSVSDGSAIGPCVRFLGATYGHALRKANEVSPTAEGIRGIKRSRKSRADENQRTDPLDQIILDYLVHFEGMDF